MINQISLESLLQTDLMFVIIQIKIHYLFQRHQLLGISYYY